MTETKGGMSRAAKKRAKKKQKKESSVSSSSDGVQSTSRDENSRNERPEPTSEEEHKEAPQRSSDLHNEKTRKKRKSPESEHSDEPVADKDMQQEQPEPEEKASAVSNSIGEQIRPPKDCVSLLEITETDDGNADNNEQSSSLADMTARERGNCALNFLLQPAGITAKEFYDEYWEQEALLIQQSSSRHRHRFDGLLSKSGIREMISQGNMRYGRDLNVTRYQLDKHGVKRRITLDLVKSPSSKACDTEKEVPDEDDFVKADPETVWKNYENGCSVRLLCPHKHSNPIHSLLQLLELEWGCMVGANAYLTPPGASQGFAPHYDDIEAFCLQLEGKKRWKVYAPLNKAETLPRQSSADYIEEDLSDVKPVMDVVLSPGDMLYMPRGWIHQAFTLPDGQGAKAKEGHSLHLTVSAMQQWAWVDLMEIVLPEALNAAAASDTSTALRDGLPLRFLDYMGAAHANKDLPELLKKKAEDASTDSAEVRVQELQEAFKSEAKMRIMRVAKEAMDLLDASCDQLSKQFISARQPPALSEKERSATSAGKAQSVKIEPGMLVRMVRPGVARLILEDEKAIIYHCLDNSREYHGRPLSPLEFELDDGPALEQLLRTAEPQWICVQDLFHDSIEDKLGVTQALFDEGLLMVRE